MCDERDAPDGARREAGWRAFRLHGPIPFETTGVIASLSAALAGAGVGLFVVSTFDTDIVLVKTPDAPRAEEALRQAGWELEERR